MDILEKRPEEMLSAVTDRDASDILSEKKLDIESLSKYLEFQLEAFKRLRIILLSFTKEKDWVNIDGHPFLQESGAQAIAIPMGVNVVDVQSEKRWEEDKLGRYYIWTYRAKAYSLKIGREIQVEGICSSRDRFFGKVGGEYRELEDIDEAQIQRKAFTSLYRNAVTRLLGLRNIQWEELSQAKLNIASIRKVEHTVRGSKTGLADKAIEEAQEKPPTPTFDASVLHKTEALIKRLFSAPNLEALKEVWDKDKEERRTLPRELLETVVEAKNQRKKLLSETSGKEEF